MILRARLEFPLINAHPDSERVDRWNQLDPASQALVEFGSRTLREVERPSGIILASSGASNETDRRFVESGYASPQKFAHTLSNVRASPFCQVLKWRGPVLCIQNDPRTLHTALQEGVALQGFWKSVWVVGIRPAGASAYGAIVFCLTDPPTFNFKEWLALSETEVWERRVQ